MKILLKVFLILAFFSSCSSNQPDRNNLADSLKKQNQEDSLNSMISTNPEIFVSINLENDTLSSGDPVMLDITLTNSSDKAQRVLFDKPPTGGSGGPWSTSAWVFNNETGKTLVKENSIVLSSMSYDYKTIMKDYGYTLKPGESLKGKYDLKSIVILNTKDGELPKGKYRIGIFYYSNQSNELTLVVK